MARRLPLDALKEQNVELGAVVVKEGPEHERYSRECFRAYHRAIYNKKRCFSFPEALNHAACA